MQPPSMASSTMFSGSKYIGLGANDAAAECSMPWSTGQDRHVARCRRGGRGRTAAAGCAAPAATGRCRRRRGRRSRGPGRVRSSSGDALGHVGEQAVGLVAEQALDVGHATPQPWDCCGFRVGPGAGRAAMARSKPRSAPLDADLVEPVVRLGQRGRPSGSMADGHDPLGHDLGAGGGGAPGPEEPATRPADHEDLVTGGQGRPGRRIGPCHRHGFGGPIVGRGPTRRRRGRRIRTAARAVADRAAAARPRG